MKRIYTYITLLALFFGMTSCEHKDLCYYHYATLKLVFDWRDAPDANPENMRVYMYPVDDGGDIDNSNNYIIRDFAPAGGYINDIPSGHYKLVCFNTTETCYERYAGSFTRQSLTTSISSLLEPVGISSYSKDFPVAVGTEDEDPHYAPDIIWGCTEVDITVTETGITHFIVGDVDPTPVESTENEIVLYPRELTSTYTVEIRNVKNTNNVTRISATLSGMAAEMNLATGDPAGEDIIVPFAAALSGGNTILGTFENFGTTFNSPNRLMLYVWMANGKVYAFGTENWERFNVTTQISAAADPHNVHIIIDGLELPVVEAQGGIDASIDDWGEEINQDINI